MTNQRVKATAMDASERPQSGLKNKASTSVNSIDKKFNVVMYGIEESLPNTSKAERQLRDLENITSAVRYVSRIGHVRERVS